MKHIILLIFLYGAALFISLEVRPIFFPPPDNLRDAKNKLLGTWSGAEGWGHFEVKNEIDFHTDWTYIKKVKNNNEELNEDSGFYAIDTVRDTKTNNYFFTVSLDAGGKGENWYFKNGDTLYPEKWGSRFMKNPGLLDRLLWFLCVPCLVGYFPARFFWKKVSHFGTDQIHPPRS